jgi:putative transposase
LLDENQVITIENLNVKGMMQNHNLARSIQELSLYEFKRKLIYKSNWYGREIIEIDRYFPSSKLCNCCGYKNDELTLKDREWQCKKCNEIHKRDYNAAKNIMKEGIKIYKEKIPIRNRELTPLEISGYTVNEKGRKDSLRNK